MDSTSSAATGLSSVLSSAVSSMAPPPGHFASSMAGISTAPPGFIFSSATLSALGSGLSPEMAAIPPSAPSASFLPGLPSAASALFSSTAPIASLLPGLPTAVSATSAIAPNIPLHGAAVVSLSNTHQVISLKLTTTNYLYWRMQMKPYLLGQGVYGFVDGSYCCPALYVSATNTAAPVINSLFLSWKQQDQLIMSALLSSLSTEILHLVVDCDTSHSIWQTLQKSFASPSHSRIMQLYGSFQDLRQGDDTITAYLQRAKVLFDELAAAGRPLSLEDFNLYIFRGLRSDFKDLVTSLSTRSEPLSYSDLHSYLLTHEYLNKSSLQSTLGSTLTAPLLPTLSAFLVQRGGFSGASGNSYRGHGRHRGGWRGYRGSNHGNSGSGWQSGSGFQQHSRGISNSNHNFRNVRCQLCYAFGHSAKYCSQFTSQHLQATANLAFRNPQLSSTGWFPDTGANQHVTPDLASMTGSEPYLGSDQLHVGDGSHNQGGAPFRSE